MNSYGVGKRLKGILMMRIKGGRSNVALEALEEGSECLELGFLLWFVVLSVALIGALALGCVGLCSVFVITEGIGALSLVGSAILLSWLVSWCWTLEIVFTVELLNNSWFVPAVSVVYAIEKGRNAQIMLNLRKPICIIIALMLHVVFLVWATFAVFIVIDLIL